MNFSMLIRQALDSNKDAFVLTHPTPFILALTHSLQLQNVFIVYASTLCSKQIVAY